VCVWGGVLYVRLKQTPPPESGVEKGGGGGGGYCVCGGEGCGVCVAGEGEGYCVCRGGGRGRGAVCMLKGRGAAGDKAEDREVPGWWMDCVWVRGEGGTVCGGMGRGAGGAVCMLREAGS